MEMFVTIGWMDGWMDGAGGQKFSNYTIDVYVRTPVLP